MRYRTEHENKNHHSGNRLYCREHEKDNRMSPVGLHLPSQPCCRNEGAAKRLQHYFRLSVSVPSRIARRSTLLSQYFAAITNTTERITSPMISVRTGRNPMAGPLENISC